MQRLSFHVGESRTGADDRTTVPSVTRHTPTAKAHLLTNQLARNHTNNDDRPLQNKLQRIKTTVKRHSPCYRRQVKTETCINIFCDAACANSFVVSLFLWCQYSFSFIPPNYNSLAENISLSEFPPALFVYLLLPLSLQWLSSFFLCLQATTTSKTEKQQKLPPSHFPKSHGDVRFCCPAFCETPSASQVAACFLSQQGQNSLRGSMCSLDTPGQQAQARPVHPFPLGGSKKPTPLCTLTPKALTHAELEGASLLPDPLKPYISSRKSKDRVQLHLHDDSTFECSYEERSKQHNAMVQHEQ